jgi:predicted TIM-barrel fold metal-dependent hydrolase
MKDCPLHYSPTEERLMDAMSAMDIIDCHEHLPPEKQRTGEPQDVFTLFSHYTRHDLFSAGMDRDADNLNPFDVRRPVYESLFDQRIPLAKRWATFEPYWERIRHGSYARAAILTARMVYGVGEISGRTFAELSERIAAENTPGIYRRILSDRCRIKASLTQNALHGCEAPLVPVVWCLDKSSFRTPKALAALCAEHGWQVRDLADCLALIGRHLDDAVAAGAVGMKTYVGRSPKPDAAAAEDCLKKVLGGGTVEPDEYGGDPLGNYLLHHAIDMAAERNMVIAIHAGVWGDFRQIDCKHLLDLSFTHPHADFDLYHLGMPSIRDAIMIAKNKPNVFLNLCWCPIVSQVQTCSGIDELLDEVPVNKILGFGGDYGRPIEKIVGHLHMARENFARVFGARIDRGLMSEDDARSILRLWFWDNPLALYKRLKQVVGRQR